MESFVFIDGESWKPPSLECDLFLFAGSERSRQNPPWVDLVPNVLMPHEVRHVCVDLEEGCFPLKRSQELKSARQQMIGKTKHRTSQ